MNIFLTRKDYYKAIQDLDDDLLKSQILLIRSILQISELKKKERENILQKLSPAAQYYIDKVEFLSFLGYICCLEYEYRFSEHPLKKYFKNYCDIYNVSLFLQPNIDLYFERKEFGNINKSGTIKGAENLMRRQLFWKWKNYSNPPRWTKREKPSWAYNLIEKDSPAK